MLGLRVSRPEAPFFFPWDGTWARAYLNTGRFQLPFARRSSLSELSFWLALERGVQPRSSLGHASWVTTQRIYVAIDTYRGPSVTQPLQPQP